MMFLLRFLPLALFLFAQNLWADQVSPQALSKEALTHISKVPEFAYIQKAAEEIGVKVYLFGGSAAAYAHYVRWYIELQNGSENHQSERFDFDYTNIYRGNQDLDLVVDGTEEQAQEFQRILKEKYAHIVGEKNDWEVRLLRSQTGDKLPLLDDPDFKNQHTDTNSTGMLDLTSKKGEPVFRDLLDWENEESQFLTDVAAARITYLFSKKHETTSRFKEEKNPPIFSAVRYLAKLTQYEVQGRPEDLEKIRSIIATTDFTRLTHYVKNKLSEFALKTLLNSPNTEYAWNLLDDLGLRQKLIKMDGNRLIATDSLSWWLNKEPLRSKPLGTQGRTALELFGKGGLIVSHETNSFQAYENITRSSRGEANAFISRENTQGESAVYGDGFYTQQGMEGARGTGLTIRFKLHPEARENEDFTLHSTYIVVKNKSALTLIQENININIIDLFTLLRENTISRSDKGLQEKLIRKFKRVDPNSKEFKDAVEFLKKMSLFDLNMPLSFPKFNELNQIKSFEDLLNLFTYINGVYFAIDLPAFIKKANPAVWEENPLWIKALIKNNIEVKYILRHILPNPFWAKFPEILTPLIGHKEYDRIIITKILSNKEWAQNEDLINYYIESDLGNFIVKHVLSQEHSLHRLDWLKALMKKKKNIKYIVEFILSQPQMAQHPEIFKEFLPQFSPLVIAKFLFSNHAQLFDAETVVEVYKRSPTEKTTLSLLEHYFSKEHSLQNEKLLEEIFKTGEYHREIIEHVLSKPFWSHKVNFVKKIISQKSSGSFQLHYDEYFQLLKLLIEHVFSQPHWVHQHELLGKLIGRKYPDLHRLILRYVLSKPYWGDHPELLAKIFQFSRVNQTFVRILALPHWKDQDQLVKKIIEMKDPNISFLVGTEVFSQPHWIQHDDLLIQLIENHKEQPYVIVGIVEQTLSQPHWIQRDDIIEHALSSLGTVDYFLKFSKRIFSNPSYLHPNPLLKSIAKSDPELLFLHYNDEFVLHYFDEIKELLSDSDRLGVTRGILKIDFWAKQPQVVLLIVKAFISLHKGAYNKESLRKDLQKSLQLKIWKTHPFLINYLDGKSVTLKNLIEKIQTEETQRLSTQTNQCSALLH